MMLLLVERKEKCRSGLRAPFLFSSVSCQFLGDGGFTGHGIKEATLSFKQVPLKLRKECMYEAADRTVAVMMSASYSCLTLS